MFDATPHPFLVPFDGTFDVRAAATKPAKNGKKDEPWKADLAAEVQALGEAQYRLYADGRYAALIVFQALDAAGKDGTIRHVFTGVNPNGLQVASFKQPSREELAHDFLWRTTARLPERGHIAIFNRSYYEEVLVVRVHPEYLAAQRLPEPVSPQFWEARCRAIADHERHLAEQGTLILKFWLNVSKEEQRERFLERIDESDKNWKFNAGDLDEREHFDDYLEAYQHCLNATSRPWAPWYAIPADNKHFMRWQVARLINDALGTLDAGFPKLAAPDRASLAAARKRLELEG
jgi:PPK2 family polyphosphate:nucleotide phosphotransferase